ncbi:unnamed protein product [Haemonchus placei]|uniref:Transposase n=1 Tax=Haemonchus placei TaxID=6290 RepID=A0A0N4WPQ0_HAEPC|nr:unnamed protein product [Haemonchus placei]
MALNALKRRNRQQELLDFSLKDVYEKMQMDHLDLQERLRSMGLLALPLCPLCQGSMSPRNDEHRNGWVCHRRPCRTGPSNETKVYVPARKGSFENSNPAESAVFALSYFSLRDMGTVKDKVYELNIGHGSVVQWEQYFRDVCAEHYRRNPPVIGGFGCTVEIDETLVARRKYSRGRWVCRHQWLFGRYRERERTSISEAGAKEGRSDSASSYRKVYKTWHDDHQ